MWLAGRRRRPGIAASRRPQGGRAARSTMSCPQGHGRFRRGIDRRQTALPWRVRECSPRRPIGAEAPKRQDPTASPTCNCVRHWLAYDGVVPSARQSARNATAHSGICAKSQESVATPNPPSNDLHASRVSQSHEIEFLAWVTMLRFGECSSGAAPIRNNSSQTGGRDAWLAWPSAA